MAEINRAAHQANYEHGVEKLKKALTVQQLHDITATAIAEGHGKRPCALMEVDGFTMAHPIVQAFSSEPYDGEMFWLLADEEGK